MTKLVYLRDTYAFEHVSNVAGTGHDDKGTFLLLAETVFYPQGGGQPCDTGTLNIDGSEHTVNNVQFVEGHVRHYLAAEATIAVGAECRAAVYQERRLRNARLHTLGHLISNIVEEKLVHTLVAKKGYHFPDGSYVEFEGEKGEFSTDLLDRLNAELGEAIASNVAVREREVDVATLKELGVRTPVGLAPEKPLRIVTIGDFQPIPCGGTHVSSTAEIGAARVSRVSNKKGATRISYQLME